MCDAQLKADKGTKVPDLGMKELLLELEVSLSVTLEYSLVAGWAVGGRTNNNRQLAVRQAGSFAFLLADGCPGLLTACCSWAGLVSRAVLAAAAAEPASCFHLTCIQYSQVAASGYCDMFHVPCTNPIPCV